MLQKQKKTQVWRRKFRTKKKAQNHVRINQQFKWAIVNDITFRCFPTKKRGGPGEEKQKREGGREEKDIDRVREGEISRESERERQKEKTKGERQTERDTEREKIEREREKDLLTE